MEARVAETMGQAIANKSKRRGRVENLKPFKPGQSGNPSGRPKKDRTAEALALEHAEKAMKTLVKVMDSEDATPSARVAAASEVLDRAFGKAAQKVDANMQVNLVAKFEDFIRELNGAKMIEHAAEDAEVVPLIAAE